MSGVKPWVNAVADKPNIFVGHAEWQKDQCHQKNLEQANNASDDVEEPVAPIGKQRPAVAFPNQDRDRPEKKRENKQSQAPAYERQQDFLVRQTGNALG
jgi:hypothetical protein